jgi:hypothetical protein
MLQSFTSVGGPYEVVKRVIYGHWVLKLDMCNARHHLPGARS